MDRGLRNNRVHPFQPIVVGIGELLWDVFGQQRELGGAPANFSCHAANLGFETYLISAVGDDELGKSAVTTLSNKKVESKFVHTLKNRPTGQVVVQVDVQGRPQYDVQSDAAWDDIRWSEELDDLAKKCDAVCFGTLAQRSKTSRDSILRFLELTRPDCLRIFDVNLRQPHYTDEILIQSLQHANVLKVNDKELPVVGAAAETKFQERKRCVRELAMRFDLKLVALTMGKQGALLFADGQFSRHNSPTKLAIRDTVGAGDIFAAVTMFGMLNRLDLDQINQLANLFAEFVCTQLGPTPILPRHLLKLAKQRN